MSLFRKALSSIVELDPEEAPAAPAGVPSAAPSIAPPSAVVAGHPSVTPATTTEDVKLAQHAVLNAVRYAEKANLVKHTTLVSKLIGRAASEADAIASAFDSLDVVDIKREVVVGEANACIIAVDVLIKTTATDTDKALEAIATRKTITLNDLNREAADVQAQITALQTRASSISASLASLDANFESEKQTALSKRDLITAIAIELRSAWQKVTAK